VVGRKATSESESPVVGGPGARLGDSDPKPETLSPLVDSPGAPPGFTGKLAVNCQWELRATSTTLQRQRRGGPGAARCAQRRAVRRSYEAVELAPPPASGPSRSPTGMPGMPISVGAAGAGGPGGTIVASESPALSGRRSHWHAD
jgi:hypothetical protein